MDKKQINQIAKLLSHVEITQGIQFIHRLQEGKILEYLTFKDLNGVIVSYKDDNEYNIICAFKDILHDYNIIMQIDNFVKKYLRLLKDDEILIFTHDGRQLLLNNFICKLNFNKPHYGLAYRLNKRDFNYSSNINNLNVLKNEKDAYNKLIDLHTKAFKDQNIRSGVTSGYDEDDLTSLKHRFNDLTEESNLFTFYEKNNLIGYTLFNGNELDLIAVKPIYQANGYGDKIIQYSINEVFKNNEIKFVYLYTFYINIRAQQLYEKIGFKKINFYCFNNSKNKKDLFL